MSITICKTEYKDVEAISMESRLLRAFFLPAYGAKMASLICKETGREFLVQAEGENYKKLSYAGDYVAAECSGFDNMFPTIDEYEYPKFPWRGTMMPDHGEVCGLPWEYEIHESNTCLHCWVNSVRFSYSLHKWIHFTDDCEISIEYEVKNLCPFDLDFIWAGHVMINSQEGAKITLPYKPGSRASCVFSKDSSFSKPGMPLTWPITQTVSGKTVDLSKTRSLNTIGNTYKYYFDEPVPEGWFGYGYTDGTTITLSVSKVTVPYLGVWVNEGVFKGYYNIAFEPCTGAFDDPGKARKKEQYSVLPANSEYAWELNFKVIK